MTYVDEIARTPLVSVQYSPLIEKVPKALSASTVGGETPGLVWGPYRFKFTFKFRLEISSVILVGDSELM